MCYTVDEIRQRVHEATEEYNRHAEADARIKRMTLFGSYADGSATDNSDVDLLVTFFSPVVGFFTLARVLDTMETHLGLPVDLVQDPLPADTLLTIRKRVPLYDAA